MKKFAEHKVAVWIGTVIIGFILASIGTSVSNDFIFGLGMTCLFGSVVVLFILIGYASVATANAEEEAKKQRIAIAKAPGKMITCSVCKKKVSNKAKSCPECGNPIDTKVYCPKCSSYNTKPISNADKAVSVGVVGVFAANKVVSKYKCLDCNHKF